MKIRTLRAAMLATAAFLVVGSAHADTIAGFDFSQYFASGFLSTDGGSFTNTLDANYSNLDPTFGAGAESAAFGSMLMDGAAGSTNVDPADANAAFIPFTGSLASNLTAPVPGSVEFDSLTVLTDEGQAFANLLGMTAQDAVQVVFTADLSSVPEFGEDWELSFAGKTFSGVSSVGVEFSTDGSSYASFGSANLTAVDTQFVIPLDAVGTDTAFVRLTFATPAGEGVNQAIIDNLAINATLVPEPGTALLLVAGLAGLLGFGRKR